MMTNLMTILERKVFISSNPRIVLSSCPPPCGHFSIQESATGGLSYKVKKHCQTDSATSFHATGCHFTGPVALRPRLSSGLPISLLFLNFCKKTGFIILWFSTVYKKNITVLTPENQKRTADTYTRTVLLLSKSTKH